MYSYVVIRPAVRSFVRSLSPFPPLAHHITHTVVPLLCIALSLSLYIYMCVFLEQQARHHPRGKGKDRLIMKKETHLEHTLAVVPCFVLCARAESSFAQPKVSQ